MQKPILAAPVLADAEVQYTSSGLGWPGIHLEIGINAGCNADPVMVDGHFVGMQLLDDPLTARIKKDQVRSSDLITRRASITRIACLHSDGRISIPPPVWW